MPQPDDFFRALVEWRAWTATLKASAERLSTLARKKHKRARLETNLLRDNHGRIWRHRNWIGSTGYEEVRRSSEPFGPYHAHGALKKCGDGPEELLYLLEATSVQRSYECPEEDWPWELETKRGEKSTYELAQADIASTEAGIALVDLLLTRRKPIENWMISMGHALDRQNPDSIELDWPTLLAKFAPTHARQRLPHHDKLKGVLHAIIDDLGGFPGIRQYRT